MNKKWIGLLLGVSYLSLGVVAQAFEGPIKDTDLLFLENLVTGLENSNQTYNAENVGKEIISDMLPPLSEKDTFLFKRRVRTEEPTETSVKASELANEVDTKAEEMPSGEVTTEEAQAMEAYTSRGIRVGMKLGKVLSRYGPPDTIWRNKEGTSHILLYTVSNNGGIVPVERAVKGTYRNHSYTTTLDKEQPSEGRYLAFTIQDDKVMQMEVGDMDALQGSRIPVSEIQKVYPKELKDRDFSIQGYRLHTKLNRFEAEDWQGTGNIGNHRVMYYSNVYVMYDSECMISAVIPVHSRALTARGIAIGNHKSLLLFVYGEPTHLFEDVVEKDLLDLRGQPCDYYVYDAPDAPFTKLVFAIHKDNGYIEQITLTDRVTEK